MRARQASFRQEDVGNAKRKLAVSSVAFSSIFYCSRPFAAALTRKRFQLLYFVIGLLMCSEGRILDAYNAFYGDNCYRSNHIRFEFTGCENLNTLKIEPTNRSHRLIPVSYNCDVAADNSFYNLEFSSRVCFDGWIIHVPPDLPDCGRSLRFSVHIKERDGILFQEQWKLVDSSSKIHITDRKLFLNGSFDLAKYRGTDVRFRTSKFNIFGFIIPEAFAGIYLGLLGVLGFAGNVKLAARLPVYNGFFFISCQVIHSMIYFSSPGDYTSRFHMALAFAECLALILMSYEQWVFLFLWDGLFFSLIACSVMGLGEEGAGCARRFFGLGLPFIMLGCSIKALQLWTCRSARRAIQGDFCKYQAIWDSLISDPASRRAVREMEILLAAPGEAFVRCSSGPRNRLPSSWFRSLIDSAATYCTRKQQNASKTFPVHQEILVRDQRARSLVNVLTLPEEADLQTQLLNLYEDAASADIVFRLWVLELARLSRGMLRATDTYELTGRSQDGVNKTLVDGYGGMQYLYVSNDVQLEDIAWAGLKSFPRSVEKVIIAYHDFMCLHNSYN